jgi:hypothetical protein
MQAKVDTLKRLQAETSSELDALLPAIVPDCRAFLPLLLTQEGGVWEARSCFPPLSNSLTHSFLVGREGTCVDTNASWERRQFGRSKREFLRGIDSGDNGGIGKKRRDPLRLHKTLRFFLSLGVQEPRSCT